MLRLLASLLLVTLSAFARTETPVAPLTYAPVPAWFPPAIAGDGVQSFAAWIRQP